MPHFDRWSSIRGVVLVADIRPLSSATDIQFRRDLEATDPETFTAIVGSIERLGLTVTHYEHPSALASHAQRHRDDVVLSIFGGAVSRNRMALVPAICETFGLRYIGPDAYGRILCQDKELSKAVA